jgi:O-antigen/teichoic acid export membrane protein
LWRDSWPLMLSAAAATIYLRIDQVMVGRIMGDVAVGIYAAGVKLTEVFYFIPGVIAGSLFPAIVNAKKTAATMYFRRLKNLYALLAIFALLVALPISFLAKPIISLVFGIEYLASAPVLQLYIWSSFGLFLGAGVSNQLMAENRTKAIFGVNLVAMVVNVGLNLYLIPKLGLIGAALTTLVSYAIIPLWLFFFGWKKSRKEI